MKNFPLNKQEFLNLTKNIPTPFYIYDEKLIRENFKYLKQCFNIFPKFKEYFAVKACPNPFILKILKEEGSGADCSSLPELYLAKKVGIKNSNVIFTSNQTPKEEYLFAYNEGNIINLDDITHIEYLKKTLNNKFPETICFRYNPGDKNSDNLFIGKQTESKYGLTKNQIFEAYEICKNLGVKKFGIHIMIASNELDINKLLIPIKIVFDLFIEIQKKCNINIEFIDLGGGIGIPYKPDEKKIDLNFFANEVKKLYDNILKVNNLEPEIYFECGRLITGPYGWLITKAIHEKHIYKEYIGVDACMADLMRPGIYNAYHEISVLGKENEEKNFIYDIVGSLCENIDKFCINRKLPKIDVGDIIIIHDVGAHGRAMGFNYNGKLRCGEYLLREDKSLIEIRRKETIEDYFNTIDFEKFKEFE